MPRSPKAKKSPKEARFLKSPKAVKSIKALNFLKDIARSPSYQVTKIREVTKPKIHSHGTSEHIVKKTNKSPRAKSKSPKAAKSPQHKSKSPTAAKSP